MTVTTKRLRARWIAGLLALLPIAAACSTAVSSPSPSPSATPTPAPLVPVPTWTLGPSPSGCPSAAPTAWPTSQVSDVTLHTSMGDITIHVEAKLAPIAAANFVALSSCGFYNNTIFHRVAPSFVIQGGDGQYGRLPLNDYNAGHLGQGGPGYTIKDEPAVGDYTRGTVAMANNGQANSAGSQFFVLLANNADLKQAQVPYQIFGHVTAGMDVVDKIAKIANGGEAANYIALQIVPIEWVTVQP